MEYRAIPIEKCKIVIQSVKIPAGKGRLYLTKDTISRKGCIIMVKNDDTICLARSIVTAQANLQPEKWTKTQLHDGFNKSRKLQKKQALHEEAQVETNDYGNDLSDIETFAKHLGIEINIIDAEQFNSIVYTSNKGSEDKIFLLKTRNHFDVIKSLLLSRIHLTIVTNLRRHTPKETSTSVHQSAYLALPMQKISNAEAKNSL